MTHILLSNDDGIRAEGLRALKKGLEGLAKITVVAPSQERSASAQSLTLRQPIFYEQIAEDEWSVDGTPADTMILALNKIVPEPPDLVISGINRGANLGENIFYSGTVGAAAEAAIHGVPAFAVSAIYRGKEVDFAGAAKFARSLAELMLHEKMPKGVLLNVNVPLHWSGGVRFTRQSEKITRNVLQEGTDPRGRTFCWLCEQHVQDEVAADTDYAAVFAGDISITPIHLERTHTQSLNHLSHWAKQLERKTK